MIFAEVQIICMYMMVKGQSAQLWSLPVNYIFMCVLSHFISYWYFCLILVCVFCILLWCPSQMESLYVGGLAHHSIYFCIICMIYTISDLTTQGNNWMGIIVKKNPNTLYLKPTIFFGLLFTTRNYFGWIAYLFSLFSSVLHFCLVPHLCCTYMYICLISFLSHVSEIDTLCLARTTEKIKCVIIIMRSSGQYLIVREELF